MSSSTKQRSGGRKGKILNDSSISLPPAPLASASASVVGSNVDMLTLILTRLPAKTLLVFKSVSKQWLALITDPKFVHKHFTQNPNLSVPGLFWGSKAEPRYEYIFLDGNTNSYVPFETLAFKVESSLDVGVNIVQSCNGLLLCSNIMSCAYNSDITCYIFNPFTKMYKILPPSQMRSRDLPYLGNICLAFDPFKSPYYKVVSFWWKSGGPNCYNCGVEIYDSETSSWRLSGFNSYSFRNGDPPSIVLDDIGGIFWNGSLYWCNRYGYVAYFDIGQELIGVVPLPSTAQTNRYSKAKIAEYGGHLYLMERDRAHYNRFSIFEMDSADSSWNLKGQVDARLNPYAVSHCGSTNLSYMDYIIFITDNEKEKESSKVVLLTKESKVLSYDLKDMNFEKIYDLSANQKIDSSVKFYQYIESLDCV